MFGQKIHGFIDLFLSACMLALFVIIVFLFVAGILGNLFIH